MKLLSILTISVCLGMLYPASDTKPYVADIETETSNKITTFTGYFQNDSSTPVRLVYRLTMERKGRSGQSSTSQGGVFAAEPGQRVSLSQLQVNVTDEDTYTVTLRIYSGQELVAKKLIKSSLH